MNKYDIIFVNAKETVYDFHTLEDSASVPTLIYHLGELGLDKIISFPETEDQQNVSVVRDKFKEFLKYHEAPIFGISSWTNTHAFAMEFAKDIRERYPEALIIGGGPHYLSDEEIKIDLENRYVDIIFKGGADPFFQFAKSFFLKGDIKIEKKEKGLEITGNIPGKGMHYLSEEGEIVSKPQGKMSYPVYPLVHFDDKKFDLRVMYNDVCGNACDYCVIDNKRIDKKHRPVLFEWINSIRQDIEENYKKPIMISISDSAPFSGKNRAETKDFLETLKKADSDNTYNIFMDPADVDDDFYDLMERYNINSFFLGRDRIVEDHIIGRKLNGIHRSQSQLDKEYQNVKDFLEFLRERAKKTHQEVFIGYILSPFEKEKDSKRLIEEVIEFTSFPKPYEPLLVQANIFLLNPYPGTKVAKTLIGKYIPMREFYHSIPNCWVSKDSNMLFLEGAKHIIARMFCNLDTSGIYRPLLQLFHDIQFNKQFDRNLVKEIKDKTMRNFATYVIERILALRLGEEKDLDTYFDNLLKMHYMGCMVPLILHDPKLFSRGDLLPAIKKMDVAAPLLKKDFQMLRKAAEEGRAPCLEKYL